MGLSLAACLPFVTSLQLCTTPGLLLVVSAAHYKGAYLLLSFCSALYCAAFVGGINYLGRLYDPEAGVVRSGMAVETRDLQPDVRAGAARMPTLRFNSASSFADHP